MQNKHLRCAILLRALLGLSSMGLVGCNLKSEPPAMKSKLAQEENEAPKEFTPEEIAARKGKLKPGALGVVRVLEETGSAYEIEIIFPESSLAKVPESLDPASLKTKKYQSEDDGNDDGDDDDEQQTAKSDYLISAPAEFEIFDDKGVIAKIDRVGDFNYRIWCNANHKVQLRPSRRTKVLKSFMTRAFRPKNGVDQILAFVRYGPKSKHQTPVDPKQLGERTQMTEEYRTMREMGVSEPKLREVQPPRLEITGDYDSNQSLDAALVTYTSDPGCGKDEADDGLEFWTFEGAHAMRCCR